MTCDKDSNARRTTSTARPYAVEPQVGRYLTMCWSRCRSSATYRRSAETSAHSESAKRRTSELDANTSSDAAPPTTTPRTTTPTRTSPPNTSRRRVDTLLTFWNDGVCSTLSSPTSGFVCQIIASSSPRRTVRYCSRRARDSAVNNRITCISYGNSQSQSSKGEISSYTDKTKLTAKEIVSHKCTEKHYSVFAV